MLYNVLGVDVNHYHSCTDFSKLPSNISFFGAKATQGETFADKSFIAHREGARKKGFILTIYYHFADGMDPEKEADNFLSVVGPLQPNERLALDVERPNNQGWMPRVDWIQKFLDLLPKDRKPILYTSNQIWNTMGNPDYPDATVGNVDLWAPRYMSGTSEPTLPTPWSFWTFWQFSSTYNVPGVQGLCDASYFFQDINALKQYATLKNL